MPPSVTAIASAPGSDFYYASLYLPPRARSAVNVLEACRREITRIPQTCSDRGVAHTKLAWWRDEFKRLGEASPRHELTRGLSLLNAADDGLAEVFIELIEKTAASLQEPVFETREDVFEAIRDLHGAVFRRMILAVGDCDAAAMAALVDLACATELAYELRDLRQHRRGGLLYLAGDALGRHGLHVEQLRQVTDSAALGDLMDQEIEYAVARLDNAHAQLGRPARRRGRLFCTLARIIRRALVLTLEGGCQVLERRIELLPVHKLWIAWRTRITG
ncbi:MAG: squalene/phytoene synthase family protein [Gammaproteobacteria bacterium]|nr:squalene/phytoene synthase family protein [Gammaproteobacteria bacterium]